ncbi:MAG TPA: 1-deoxy-D-xylulose-5-phosphate reductoisomerase [Acidobacteriota bacterium]|nr:1-deoxy-D-xylulose-5-phosphate reductoisomerase [Acidobacteriota bacterium]
MENRRERVAVLGSTGSIGRSTLEVAGRLRQLFKVVGLAAGSNVSLLLEQAVAFGPEIVSLRTERDAAEFRRRFGGRKVRVVSGPEGAAEVAGRPGNDIVVSAITGIDGLGPTLAAVRAGTKVALANKESLVVAGAFLRKEARRSGARILPVDSEHSGVFQCLAREKRRFVSRVILTASGGPFFRTPASEIADKTPEEALRHPRWKMGRKVTVDSATLMNKGLELIEARWLFDLEPARLDVLIHPQSVVHALVEFRDGSVLAQLSRTDMKVPIQYALTWPDREASPLAPLDLVRAGALEFHHVEPARFPLFALARTVLEKGESLPAALNAANEVAVAAFLAGRIRFGRIAEVVERSLEGHVKRPVRGLPEVYEIDRETRERTREILKQRT